MKFLSLSLLFILMSADLFSAEKKWIPIEPIDMNEKRKTDTNSSKPQAGNKTIHNLKIIKNLLDHVNKGEINTENEKSWYSLDIDDN